MIRSRTDLTRAIQRAELQGARLLAGHNMGSVTERKDLGQLLMDLADVARRANDRTGVTNE